MIKCNEISEFIDGHFQLFLNPITTKDLVKILDKTHKYIWGFAHEEDFYVWKSYNHTLFNNEIPKHSIKSRNIKMEYLMEIEDFLDFIPYINNTLKIVQTNIEPPYYVNRENLLDKQWYSLLENKIKYLFELDMPGSPDYSRIVSSNRLFLENLIKKFT